MRGLRKSLCDDPNQAQSLGTVRTRGARVCTCVYWRVFASFSQLFVHFVPLLASFNLCDVALLGERLVLFTNSSAPRGEEDRLFEKSHTAFFFALQHGRLGWPSCTHWSLKLPP